MAHHRSVTSVVADLATDLTTIQGPPDPAALREVIDDLGSLSFKTLAYIKPAPPPERETLHWRSQYRVSEYMDFRDVSATLATCLSVNAKAF